VIAAALLSLPAGADASAFFKGPLNDGANNAGVEFRVKFRHGEPRKALEFRWFNVPVPPQCYDSCEGTRFAMKVSGSGRFRGDYDVPDSDHVAKVRGGSGTPRRRPSAGSSSRGRSPAAA